MNSNTQRIEQIRIRLIGAFSPTSLKVIDESKKHIGHSGAKTGAGHFHIIISADSFNNKSMLQSHRMIYDALRDMLGTQIHALSIDIV